MSQKNVLQQILRSELETVRQFVELLEYEQSLFVNGKMDELATLVADKDRVVDQLMRLAAQRNCFLTDANFSVDSKGVRAWLSANPTAASIACDWEELLDLAHLAKQMSQTNANITAEWLQYTKRTLRALQGAAGMISLYDAKGQLA